MSSVFLSMFLFSRFHGNVGLNQLVRVHHLLFLLTCDFILIKGKMKRFSYGLLTRVALQALYALKANLLRKKKEYTYAHELHGIF